MRSAILAATCLAVLAACGEAPAPAPPAPPAAAPAPPPPRAARPDEAAAAPSPLLRDDRGGWDPPADLLDLAARLGDPATKADAADAIAVLPLARRIDVLRAGLRLRDDAAARACASRMQWRWLDPWECARCADLLVEDVLRPGSEADFEELRSYLGNSEMPRLFASAPPLPWNDGLTPKGVAGQMHRMIRPEHARLFLLGEGSPVPELRDPMATEYFATAWRHTDRNRAAYAEWTMQDDGGATPDGPGLPRPFRAQIRQATEWAPGADVWEPNSWELRWLFASDVPGDDAALVGAAIDRLPTRSDVRRVAILLLGKATDAGSESLLRRLVADDDVHADAARLSLVRRRAPEFVDRAESQAADDADALATLMEADPRRARAFLEPRLLGEDDAAAFRVLSTLAWFVQPGADDLPAGHPDWRRTSFDGIEAAAAARPLPALRLAGIALIVPGGRTKRLAQQIAERLQPDDLRIGVADEDDVLDWLALDRLGAFLETGAPDAFRAALRRIASSDGGTADFALDWLLAIGDPESADRLIERSEATGAPCVTLARTRSPRVREHFEQAIRTAQAAAGDPYQSAYLRSLVAGLAVFHGIPEDAALAFDTDLTQEQIDAVIDGRPVDALVSILRDLLARADPDDPDVPGPQWAGNVGAVRDPRIREWLLDVRRRRELDCAWWATGQLAAQGDPAARAEVLQVIRDGRYRLIDDDGEPFPLTLGWDLAATVPHWIDELETNCCRACVANTVLEETLGFRDGSQIRTDAERAREIWDAAGGRFAPSRILGASDSVPRVWVAEPR